MSNRILPEELEKLQHDKVLSFSESLGEQILFKVKPDGQWLRGLLVGLDVEDNRVKISNIAKTVSGWQYPLYEDGTPRVRQ